MDNFSQILQRKPTGDTSSSGSHSRGTTPFKVQVNFEISIFEGQIDVDIIDRWLNLLEGYFLVHDFSNWENINFSLLKVAPMSRTGGKATLNRGMREKPIFSVTPTWNYF